jgi:hypothetical protein
MGFADELAGVDDETMRARFTRLRLADHALYERVLRDPAATYEPSLLVIMPDLVDAASHGGYQLRTTVQSWVLAHRVL